MPYTIKTARKSGKYSLSKLFQEWDNEKEALAGLNEMMRMGGDVRLSCMRILMAVNKEREYLFTEPRTLRYYITIVVTKRV